LFNIALISVTIILLMRSQDASSAALVLAATVGIAGLLQLGILVLRRGENFATPLRVSFDAPMRGFFCKAIPGMVANSGPQLLIVAGAIVASSSPSAVSWLYFANRLIELPLGIVGVAMGVVLLPELTRAVQDDDRTSVLHAESRAFELAVGLALPATLGLIVLSHPIVHVLFEHGAFTPSDAGATAQALALLALGLPAHVLVKVLSPAFFARGDTMTPLIATLKGIAVAIVSAIVLGQMFGPSGIAASIALGAWSNAFTLIRRASAMFGLSLDAAARRRLPRIILAAMVMGCLLWMKAIFVWPLAVDGHGVAQAALLAVLMAGGSAIYVVLLLLFGAVNRAETISAIKRSPPRDLRA